MDFVLPMTAYEKVALCKVGDNGGGGSTGTNADTGTLSTYNQALLSIYKHDIAKYYVSKVEKDSQYAYKS